MRPKYSEYSMLSQSSYDADKYKSYFQYNNINKTLKYSETVPISKARVTEPQQSYLECICMKAVIILAHIVFCFTLPFSALFAFKMVHQFERVIVYRLGRLRPIKGPGLIFVLPCTDKWKKIDLRTKAFNIPPSKLRSTDGCILSIGAMVHFRITDPMLAQLSIQNLNQSIRDVAQPAMVNLLSKKTYDEIKTKRKNYGLDLEIDINLVVQDWGLEVGRVELSDVTVIMAPKVEAPPMFMPMYGAPLPPSGESSDTMSGFAQMAQQFISFASQPNNQMVSSNLQPPVVQQSNEVPMASARAAALDQLVEKIRSILCEELVNEVGLAFQFIVAGNRQIFLDLRQGKGDVGDGAIQNPDVTLEMSEDTLQELLIGELSPTTAYLTGRLSLDGDRNDAMKLSSIINYLK